MTYVQLLSEGTRMARKEHQCFDCSRPISKGEIYAFQTCKYDDIYTVRQHKDCRNASEYYRKATGLGSYDFDGDGIPPLSDMLHNAGEFDLDVSMLRGRFPHVACRLEFTKQIAAVRCGETPA